ncbi:MAG: response regulator [Saprospiraceae bacterium]
MKKTILLIDDCDMMRRFLTPVFSDNFNVIAMHHPFEAILWLKTNPAPDVIVLDFEFPDMNGLEMLQHLRIRKAWSEVPVIMLSGLKNTEMRWKCLETGANDFLSKPFHPKELVLRVNALIKNRQDKPIALEESY